MKQPNGYLELLAFLGDWRTGHCLVRFFILRSTPYYYFLAEKPLALANQQRANFGILPGNKDNIPQQTGLADGILYI